MTDGTKYQADLTQTIGQAIEEAIRGQGVSSSDVCSALCLLVMTSLTDRPVPDAVSWAHGKMQFWGRIISMISQGRIGTAGSC